jgi:Uncharacterized protein conserved in bacteria
MDYVLIVIAIILALVGLIGAIVPGIAGPPFSFLAILALSFVNNVCYSMSFIVIVGVLATLITILDYVVPVWGTKKFGGTKAGVRGSTLGLVAGLIITFLFPIGFIAILLGPFLGAYIGEKSSGVPDNKAWRSAFGSFVGFLAGTFIKVVFAIVMLVFVIKDVITSFL